MDEQLLEKKETTFTSSHLESILYQMINDHISDMVFIMKVESGPTYRYVYANTRGLQAAGIDETALGQLMNKQLSSELYEILHKMYDNVLHSKKKRVFFDEVYSHEKDQITYNESVLTPIFTDKGKVDYIVSITRDFTALVQEKQKLEESNQKFHSLIEHNLDAIISLDQVGVVISANSSAIQLFESSPKKMSEMNIFDFFQKQDRSLVLKTISETLKGKAREIKSCTILNRRGISMTIHAKFIPIIIEDDVCGIYMIARDLTQQWENLEKIKYLSVHDQLTGLWNRRALLEHIDVSILENKDEKSELSVLYIDLDRFKFFNDTLGHHSGDLILVSLAERLSSLTSGSAQLYRQGGDEFIFFLKNHTKQETDRFAQKIVNLFNHPLLIKGQEYYMTPSIGISMYPTNGLNAESLIKNADQALFQVKERGRAHYRFYQSKMHDVFPNNILMEAHLKRAIEKNELKLHYQPQINLITGEINSLEGLLRWNNQKFGVVSPGLFIQLAEETGLILPIGEWVINHACAQLGHWIKKGINNLRVAINISPKQFGQEQLPEIIQKALLENNVPAHCLEIEITEGALFDPRETLSMLQRLKELGIIISVDDFGTGYSSLNYLKRFPIDILKIDQSFVKDMIHGSKDAAIAQTIIKLAHSLGMEVVAEGVEHEEQANLLKESHCEKAQGFLYSQAVSAEEIEKYLLVR
ncbi:sensor domain-containing protein [Bacillus sp. 2205SS5-2]|uniref:sensor domain-containing protein n=1 Tax=Bacillus sp. 2205SS5-2 TaxID=3109031 RepID=UPI0030041E73